VPLRDTRTLRDWAISTTPSDNDWQRVHLWIVGLDDSPWRAPSVPVESRSDRPNYEVRAATVDGSDIIVEYRRTYNGEFVDLLAIGSSSSTTPGSR
jgi:hypothetical protein